MLIPNEIVSSTSRIAYVHGYNAAVAGEVASPYSGKLTQKAYMAGYAAGLATK